MPCSGGMFYPGRVDPQFDLEEFDRDMEERMREFRESPEGKKLCAELTRLGLGPALDPRPARKPAVPNFRLPRSG